MALYAHRYTRRHTTTISEESVAFNTSESEERGEPFGPMSGNTIQDGMVVSMLVPRPGHARTERQTDGDRRAGKEDAHQREKTEKAENMSGLSQVFVMVFKAQKAQYVTYSCHLPVTHM